MTIEKKSLIAWVGGKRLLRKTIEKLIPKDIKSYIEPFGGAGWVLFYKDRWADVEIYNDLDNRLVNLFRIVKYHPAAFIEELRSTLISREMFMQFLKGVFVTDIQRAIQFFYLITRSFGGIGTTFGTSKTSSRASILNAISKTNEIHKRLDKVTIENKDFEELIKKYDFDSAFFYCDPPYTLGAGYAVTSTKDFDHEKLRDTLKNISGRFLLSYDNSPKVRELYKDFEMVEVERMNGINKLSTLKNKQYKELLIANYPIKDLM